MAITINGSAGTITGLSAGGLPDGSVTNDDLAGSIADGKITGLTASKLTGALPAIAGASLTTLPAIPFGLITHESTVKTSGIQLDFGDVSVTTSGANGHATVTFNTAFSAIWAVSITGVSRISSTRCFTYTRSHSTTTLDVSVFNDYDSSNRTYELNWLVIGAKA